MNNAIRYIAFILLLSSCSSFKFLSKDIQGTYVQEENKNVRLVFNGDAFVYIDPYTNNDLALYTCCDTITYGSWGLDNSRGLIYLSSPEFINASIVNLQVTEKKTNETDTLYFYINKPIEQHYKKYQEKSRDIYYKIAIDTRNMGFLDKAMLKEYDTNVIKVLKPKGAIVDKFTISIYPKSNFGGRNIATREVTTLEYQLKETNANVFEVNIPLLDYGYISYLRLNKDFVKVINKNKLEWNNHTYIK